MLEDTDPNKFIAKIGAEAIYDLLARLDLDSLSYAVANRLCLHDGAIRKTKNLSPDEPTNHRWLQHRSLRGRSYREKSTS